MGTELRRSGIYVFDSHQQKKTMFNDNFASRGWQVTIADDHFWLDKLRAEVYEVTRKTFNLTEVNPEFGFNNLHKSIGELSGGELNARRMTLIRHLNTSCDVKEYVFKAFEDQIVSLIGADILAQKGCNLVIQTPRDPNPSELHRDAPANSPYEIVVWVPLVDCFSTKSMYILDISATEQALKELRSRPGNWKDFEIFAKSLACTPTVPFGSALLFHTGCLHGSEVNEENQTRISLNIRYKNLFSPSGLKNQLQFFSPLRISALARLGAAFEAKELLE